MPRVCLKRRPVCCRADTTLLSPAFCPANVTRSRNFFFFTFSAVFFLYREPPPRLYAQALRNTRYCLARRSDAISAADEAKRQRHAAERAASHTVIEPEKAAILRRMFRCQHCRANMSRMEKARHIRRHTD